MVKISVIVPVYNCEKYLSQCIQSIIEQDEKEIEIILVDDGSTDGSSSICDEFARKDERIIVVHKENEGVSVARNKGLEIAKGKYIAFVDADDYLDSKIYSTAYNEMENNNLDLIIWNYNFDRDGRIVTNENFPETCIVEGEDAIKNVSATVLCPVVCDLPTLNNKIVGMGFPWNKLYRLDIIKNYNIRFTKGIILYEDVLFIYEYLKNAKKVELLNQAIYNYRINQDGATLKYKPEIMKSNNIFLEKIYKYKEEMNNNQINAFWSRIIRCYGNIFTYYLCNKKKNSSTIKEMKYVLISQPIYKEAINNVKFKALTKKQIILVILTKMKLFWLLRIILKK